MEFKEITVDTSTLASDIEELQTALQKARDQLEAMFTDVTELDAMWEGPANAEFTRQFGIDYENTKNMCDTVESLIGNMRFAREQYDLCESEVNDIVSAIKI